MKIRVLCIVLLFSALWQAGDANDEHVLLKKMLRYYRKQGYALARPVANTTDTMDVQFGIAMTRTKFDEEKITLSSNVWLRYQWHDIYLRWNPEEFGGVTDIRLFPGDIGDENIWLPDIVAYNFELDVDRTTMAVVSSDGVVLWIPRATITVNCERNSSDHVTCPMKFGSWTYDGFKLDLDFFDDHPAVDMNDFIVADNFDVIENVAEKNVKYYACCMEPYPDLTYHLTLKERKKAWFGW